MLAVKGISKAFGNVQVLESVSFSFPERAVSAIAGPSGSGKTTLLNIIMGLVAPDSGEVMLPRDARLAAVFQEDRLIEHFSAAYNARLTAPKEVTEREIRQALATLDLDPDDKKRVTKYSGGMRRRVAIARAVLYRPNILLLDEPFKGLDEDARHKTITFVLEQCGDATVVLVSHDHEELSLMGVNSVLRLRGEKRE